MKIFVPFKNKGIGGTSTFANKLIYQLKSSGHIIIRTYQHDFDLLFIIADCPLWLPLYAKITRKRIVQRLDGIYHRATSVGIWYPLYNLKMYIIHRFLADSIVYQSQFSRRSVESFLGKPRTKHTTIIYNGVDTSAIPTRKIIDRKHNQTRLLTFAQFRRRDQIEPILESVKLLNSKNFLLDIYGSYSNNLNDFFKNLPSNIVFYGKKDNSELLRMLKEYDFFLFSDQSACPNSVIEAMAAGLPTIAFERGSIPELIRSGFNGMIVPVANSNEFFDSYPFTTLQYKIFSETIIEALDVRNQLSENSRKQAESQYMLTDMTNQYQKIFSSIL